MAEGTQYLGCATRIALGSSILWLWGAVDMQFRFGLILAAGFLAFFSSYREPKADTVYTCKVIECRCTAASQQAFAELAIDWCTKVIDNERSSNDTKAAAFLSRSVAFFDLGRFDEAVADATTAITLSSSENDKSFLATAYSKRADAYFQKIDDKEAISDYTAAIDAAGDKSIGLYNGRAQTYVVQGRYDLALADYQYAIDHGGRRTMVGLGGSLIFHAGDTKPGSYWGRGTLYFLQEKYSEAANDFSTAVNLEPTPISVLWLHYARLRAGRDDGAEFAANAVKLKLDDWPGQIVKLFLGQATANDVRHAEQTPPGQSNWDRSCDGAFGIGEWASLYKHDLVTAKSMYQFVVDSCPRSIDVAAAKLALKKIP